MLDDCDPEDSRSFSLVRLRMSVSFPDRTTSSVCGRNSMFFYNKLQLVVSFFESEMLQTQLCHEYLLSLVSCVMFFSVNEHRQLLHDNMHAHYKFNNVF